MRGPDKKPRKLRPAPVRDGLRPGVNRAFRSRKTTRNAIRRGNCLTCFRPKGKDGTVRYCRECADKRAAREREKRVATRPWDERRRTKRVALGLCGRCGADRGYEGTGTMCRPCANIANHRALANRKAPQDKIRSESGYIILTCENCFKDFEWKSSGQRVFCDACIPWFEQDATSAIDHAREQEQARKAKSFRAENLILEWQRQA